MASFSPHQRRIMINIETMPGQHGENKRPDSSVVNGVSTSHSSLSRLGDHQARGDRKIVRARGSVHLQ